MAENKNVYKLVKTGEFTSRMDTTILYSIVKTISYPEVKDWCNHYIIKDKDENEEEVREVDVVFAPDMTMEETTMINKYLKDNELYADEIYHHGGLLCISGDGDWKHFHIWLRVLMEYLGYRQVGENVTEEDGSDWYGSIHTFLKTA